MDCGEREIVGGREKCKGFDVDWGEVCVKVLELMYGSMYSSTGADL